MDTVDVSGVPPRRVVEIKPDHITDLGLELGEVDRGRARVL